MDDVFYIRASSTTSWPDCARRWAASHLSELIKDAGYTLRQTPRTIGAAVGTAVHAGAAHVLNHKIKTGTTGAIKDAAEVAIVAYKEEVGSHEIIMDQASPNGQSAETQVQRMTGAYHGQVAPGIKAVWVEHRLEARLSPRFIVAGTADVCEDGGMRDTKTGIIRRAHWPQFGTYSLLGRSHGLSVRTFHEDYIKRGSMKKPQPAPESFKYDVKVAEQMAASIFSHIEDGVTRFQTTLNPWEFMPNPSSMLCSDRYCPAWGTDFCRAHKPE